MPPFENGNGWLGVPARPGKPRDVGLTHVMDKGLNLRDIEGLFDTAGEFVDIVKFGWGTSYVTNNLEKKIALYRSFDTPVVCTGGVHNFEMAERMLADGSRIACRPIDRATLLSCAELRARLGGRTFDAIHVATALLAHCDIFLSDDERIRVPNGLQRLRLSDLKQVP